MERICRRCGDSFTPNPGPGRPRMQCEKCRAPRGRQTSTGVPKLPIAEPAGLVNSTRRQLAAGGRDGTPKGLIALTLAEQLAAGGHTASGTAALARELSSALDAALAGALREADPLDEIGARRAQKMAGA